MSVLSVWLVGGGRYTSMVLLIVSTISLIMWVTTGVDEVGSVVVLVVFLSMTNVIGAITDKRN